MGRIKMLTLVLFVAFLLIDLTTEADPDPHQRPLCISQYSLVNHACSLIQGTPLPNQSLTSDDDDEGHGHGHRQRHGHSRRHRHMHRHRSSHRRSSSEDDCCKWLNELNDECVCDLLFHLPPFLSKPAHEYTVYVEESCNVTYTCDGNMKL